MCTRRQQRGFGLVETIVVLAIASLTAVWAAGEMVAAHERSQATATGRYLLAVRGAVHAALADHWLVMRDEPALPDALPAPAWLTGMWPLDITVANLKQPKAPGVAGYLPANHPDRPPLGDDVRVRLTRTGTCPPDPASSCDIEAVVYTTAPMRSSTRWAFNPDLVAEVMMATEGYGGHARGTEPDRLRGPIFNVENPVGAVTGIVGVSASLETTLWHQFVRQGDTRHIQLRNALTVAGEITTQTGLLLDTAIAPGDSCTMDGAYASTTRHTLATCRGNVWFDLGQYVVTYQGSRLASGASVPQPSCPTGVPFATVALSNTHIVATPPDLNMQGVVTGNLSGSVSSTGAVSGTLNGAMNITSTSTATLHQGVTLTPAGANWLVAISENQPNARADVLAGCRF